MQLRTQYVKTLQQAREINYEEVEEMVQVRDHLPLSPHTDLGTSMAETIVLCEPTLAAKHRPLSSAPHTNLGNEHEVNAV